MSLHSCHLEFENFFALKDALEEDESELDGIVLDHYQYLHYLQIFPMEDYNIILHASHAIAVGFLISAKAGFTNGNDSVDMGMDIAHGAPVTHQTVPIIDCLTRHALLAKLTLDKELIESLNHTEEVSHIETRSRTVETLFGEEMLFILVAGAAVLAIILLIYGIVDQFIIRKFIAKQKTGNRSKAKNNFENENDLEIPSGVVISGTDNGLESMKLFKLKNAEYV